MAADAGSPEAMDDDVPSNDSTVKEAAAQAAHASLPVWKQAETLGYTPCGNYGCVLADRHLGLCAFPEPLGARKRSPCYRRECPEPLTPATAEPAAKPTARPDEQAPPQAEGRVISLLGINDDWREADVRKWLQKDVLPPRLDLHNMVKFLVLHTKVDLH